jgi:hypothetical protein
MDSSNSVRRLPDHLARVCSVVAGCDPRTVQRVVAGKRTLGLTRERVERALRELGIEVPPPVTTGPAQEKDGDA